MKEQKFADEKDYVKYSILRHLLQQKLSCTVCWMMTGDDDNGRRYTKTGYLDNSDLFRNYDPDVFNYLEVQERSGKPNIRSICERISPISACRFYWEQFPSDKTKRQAYFDGCLRKAAGTDLVFLDPDTGPQRNRLKPQDKDFDKYVQWDEITCIYCAGHSVMVFNSLGGTTFADNRLVVERTRLLQDNLYKADVIDAKVTVLRTCDLGFFFVVHENDWNRVERALTTILERWRDLPLWLPLIHQARPHAPTFGELLLEIPQDDLEFERLPMSDRPLNL